MQFMSLAGQSFKRTSFGRSLSCLPFCISLFVFFLRYLGDINVNGRYTRNTLEATQY